MLLTTVPVSMMSSLGFWKRMRETGAPTGHNTCTETPKPGLGMAAEDVRRGLLTKPVEARAGNAVGGDEEVLGGFSNRIIHVTRAVEQVTGQHERHAPNRSASQPQVTPMSWNIVQAPQGGVGTSLALTMPRQSIERALACSSVSRRLVVV